MPENDALPWDEAFPDTGSLQGKQDAPERMDLHAHEALVVNAAGAKLLGWLERKTILAPLSMNLPAGWTAQNMALWHEARCNLVRELKQMIRHAEEHGNG